MTHDPFQLNHQSQTTHRKCFPQGSMVPVNKTINKPQEIIFRPFVAIWLADSCDEEQYKKETHFRSTHISAYPAWMQSHTQDPICLQVHCQASGDHVQCTLIQSKCNSVSQLIYSAYYYILQYRKLWKPVFTTEWKKGIAIFFLSHSSDFFSQF